MAEKRTYRNCELRAQSAFVYLRLFHCQAFKPPWTWVSVIVDIRNGTLSETVLLISQKSCRCHSFYCCNKKNSSISIVGIRFVALYIYCLNIPASFSSSSTALLLHAIVPSPFSAACLFFTVTLLWKGQMDDLHILTVKMNYQPYQITLVPFYESAFKYNVFSLLSFALLSAQ